MRLPFDLVMIDLETNGLGGSDVRIVEVGAVRLDRELRIMDRFGELVDGRPMTPRATSVNTITDATLEGAPTFSEVGPRFADWCRAGSKSYILGAWGAHFDVAVLRSEYGRIGARYPHPGRVLDVKSVAWFDLMRRGRTSRTGGLDTVRKILGLTFEGMRHRAVDDAVMAARILQTVAADVQAVGVGQAVTRFGGASHA